MARTEQTIAFTGDVGFDAFFADRWQDANLVSPGLRSFLSSADHVVLNAEGCILEKEKAVDETGKKSFFHRIPPEAIPFLQGLGDIFHLANNHTIDAGEVGVRETIRHCEENGILHLGLGRNVEEARKPLLLNNVGLIGTAYQPACKKATETDYGCLGWQDYDSIQASIAEVRAHCRWCVIVVHGGEEFTSLPMPYTRSIYHRYLEMGADVVVGHHPHVPMNYETVGEKIIFYSLGNFIFDTPYQRYQQHTEDGILLKLHFGDSLTWEAVGLKICRDRAVVEENALPAIFTDVSPAEYEKLLPLSASVFLRACQKRMIFLYPDRFAQADEDEWNQYYFKDKRPASAKNEQLDFTVIKPLAEKAGESDYESSTLTPVKEYILAMRKAQEREKGEMQ